MNEDLVELIIFLVVGGGFFLYERNRQGKIRDSAHKMNILLGAPFAPRLERQITPEEIEMLKSKPIPLPSLKNYITFLVYGVIFCSFFLGKWAIPVIAGCVFVYIIIFAWIYKSHHDELYADTISPVMKLIGPINFALDISPSDEDFKKNRYSLSFNVGGEGFFMQGSRKDVDDPQSLFSIIKSFNHHELVEVEYTPHSKYVLKIYKYNGD